MDAMGLTNKKTNTVTTSHSGSFTPNNPDLAKAAGISLLIPGKSASRFGRRGSALGIGAVEEVVIHPGAAAPELPARAVLSSLSGRRPYWGRCPLPGTGPRACRAECHGSGDTGTWARVLRPSLGDSDPGLAPRTMIRSFLGSGTQSPSAQLHVSQYCRFCMKHHASPFPVSPPDHELPADPAPPFMPPRGPLPTSLCVSCRASRHSVCKRGCPCWGHRGFPSGLKSEGGDALAGAGVLLSHYYF